MIEYDENAEDEEQKEFIKEWVQKQRLKRNKKKEKLKFIKEWLGGKNNEEI